MILQNVNFNSLVRLFATFDHRIQQILSTAGVLRHLTIKPASPLLRAPIKYFLSHLRSPLSLQFDVNVKWSPQSLPLLTALAPRSLTLNPGFLDKSVHEMLQDHASTPHDSLKDVVALVHSDGLMNFSSLLPSLESLIINNELFKVVDSASRSPESIERFVSTLPQTLTHLSLHTTLDAQHQLWIQLLPTSLVSLTLKLHTMPLSTIFDRLPQIEKLELSAEHRVPDLPATEIPKSLAELTLLRQFTVPIIALNGSLRRSNLRSFTLDVRVDDDLPVVDVGLMLLPPTLESLALRGTVFTIETFSLPRSLTALEWRSGELPPRFNQLLQTIPALKSLKLIPRRYVENFWDGFKLDLPSGLEFLRAPLELPEIIAVKVQCPNCMIELELGLSISAPNGIEMIRSDPALLACTEPVFDFGRLSASIVAKLGIPVCSRYCSQSTKRWESNYPWPASKVILTSCIFGQLYDIGRSFPNAEEASISYWICLDLPPKLTKLNLNKTQFDSNPWPLLPSTLSHLSSDAELFTLTSLFGEPPKLKYLNVPRWTLSWSENLALSLQPEMEMLSIGIIESIPDWQITPFFAAFSSKTLRENTCIREIEFVPTGTVIAGFTYLPSEYTFTAMASLTHQALSAHLEPTFAANKFSLLRFSSAPTYMVIPTSPEIEVLHLSSDDRWQPLAPGHWETTTAVSQQLNTPQAIPALQSNNWRELVLQNAHLDLFIFPTTWSSTLVRIGLEAMGDWPTFVSSLFHRPFKYFRYTAPRKRSNLDSLYTFYLSHFDKLLFKPTPSGAFHRPLRVLLLRPIASSWLDSLE